MSKISNVLSMLEYLSSGKKYSIAELSYGCYVLNQNINVPKRFITPNAINIKNKNLFNLINRAIKEKRKCFIEYYFKDEKSTSKRTIHPYDLIILGAEWGVAAYCESKEEIRHFYLNRIKSIEILEKFYN